MERPFQLDKKGPHNERSFFEALQKRNASTPPWFIKIKKAYPGFDVRGIDFLIKVTNIHGERLSIPIQIKSSEYKAWLFTESNPDFVATGGIVYVVREGLSHKRMRADVYALLAERRHIRRSEMQVFFDTLAARKLTLSGKQVLGFIKEQRQLEKQRT